MLAERMMPALRKQFLCIEATATLLQADRILDDGPDTILVCGEANRLGGVATKADVARMTGRCSGASCKAPVSNAVAPAVLTTTPKAWPQDV